MAVNKIELVQIEGIGLPGGVATLDGAGLVPASQLPPSGANGIFDATNDGGTVPTGFDVNLTDILTFAGGDIRMDGTSVNNVFYLDHSTNNIGIRTATPTESLDMVGNFNIDGNIITEQSFKGGLSRLDLTTDSLVRFGLNMANNIGLADVSKQGGFISVDTRASQPPLSFWTRAGASAVENQAIAIDTSANVGIGTALPSAKLDVIQSGTTGVNVSGGAGGGQNINLVSPTTTAFTNLNITNTSTNSFGAIISATGATNNIGARISVSGGATKNNAIEVLAGKVLLYTGASFAPLARLDVSGEGTGTGQAFAVRDSGGVSNNLVVLDNGSVGIGTAAPIEKLHLQGRMAIGTITNTNFFTASIRTGASDGLILLNGADATVNTNRRMAMLNLGVNGASTLYYNPTTGAQDIIITNESGQATIFNQNNEDVDFRIDGVGVDNIFRVDAANDRIGIGTALPSEKLHVAGKQQWDLSTENIRIDDAGSTAATEQDWVEVSVGGVTGYIRIYATK
tara:strand:- start:2890 stop:4425 length:1536 start_codon:yes stop_codon:yes gene_type:complete